MQKKRRALIELLEPRCLLSLTVTPYDPSTSLSTLTGALIVPNTGVNLTSSSFVGGNGQAGTYSGFNLSDGTTSVVMPDGIILTSGLATNALGPNNNPDISYTWGNPGDSDLSGLIGGTTTYDANVLTLQFTTTPGTKSVGFDVVFGSDEFPEFVGQYDDVFGAFLDGTQLTYDSTKNPLTIDNNFLTLNNSGTTVSNTTPVNFDIQYDGLTTALHTQAPLDPSITTHTLKLAIADAGDDQVDSGAFLANLAGNTANPGSPSTGSPATAGAFQFDQAAESTANTGATIQLTVDRTGGSSGAATIDYATSNGTATAGNDYTSTSGTLDFADGQTSATITVPVLANAGGAASSNFNLTLSNPTGGAALGSQIASLVTLTNSKSLVQLDAATYSFANTAGSATLTVDRTGNTSAAATVDYATTDGTATSGVDYTATNGTLNFSAGDASESIVVPLIANVNGADTSTFAVTLSNSDSGTVIGTVNTSTITLTNAVALVQFSPATYTATTDDTSTTVTLTRTGNLTNADTVDYSTANGSAIAGTDYTATAGTVDFTPGESTTTILIPLLGDVDAAASTAFALNLSNPTEGAVLGLASSATIDITNAHSIAQFSVTNTSVLESAGIVTVPVTRVGNLNVSDTISFTTLDGTAVAPQNYITAYGTIHFAPGQSVASISVDVVQDLKVDPALTFEISLTNSTGNIALGGQTIDTVSITNATPPPTILMTSVVTPPAAATTAGTIAALTVTFDQALAAAPSASDFTLVRRYADGANGGGKSASITIKSVSYDPSTKTLTIVPQTPLKGNQFYELTATGSAAANLDGTALDGSGTGAAGTPYVEYFGHGRHLTYLDKNGNRVHLALRGPGVMQLIRSADGQGQTLTVVGATANTILTGSVQRTGLGGNGTTTLADLSGVELAHVSLRGSQFLVSAVHN